MDERAEPQVLNRHLAGDAQVVQKLGQEVRAANGQPRLWVLEVGKEEALEAMLDQERQTAPELWRSC